MGSSRRSDGRTRRQTGTRRLRGASTVVPPAPGLTLGDSLYDELFKRIAEGEFPEGSRLPPENELSERYGVSRPVVRQALSRLKADGLVSSRQGSGNFVLHRPEGSILRFAPAGTLADVQRCYEYRVALEGEAAMLAAGRHDAEHLHAIERAVAAHQRATSERTMDVSGDYQIHLAVARATMNHFFVETLGSLKDAILSGMTLHRNLSLELATERLASANAEHAVILEAIKSREPDEARLAMRVHLENAKRRILERSSNA